MICDEGWQGWRRWVLRLAALLCLALVLSGCQTAHFYQQAIEGQLEILTRRQPITALMENPATPASLRRQLELVLRLRAFAQSELLLPIDEHYLSYVDLGRRFAVWNVHAAPEFSLEPKTWWYPLVGRLKYRGYFSEKDARRYGERLAREGYDVFVEGVEAYSTLGWFTDPLMNTFIHHAEPILAEIIFHELAHQRLFIPGDTDFNEAFATAVAEEGVRRWLLSEQDDAAYRRYGVALDRNRQFVDLVLQTRRQLRDLYGEDLPEEWRGPLSSRGWMRHEKAAILNGLRERYEALKRRWGGYAAYDAWFARDLNNAQLNTVAVYYQLVPGFHVLLESHGGDWEAFYASVEELQALEKSSRHSLLRELGRK